MNIRYLIYASKKALADLAVVYIQHQDFMKEGGGGERRVAEVTGFISMVT